MFFLWVGFIVISGMIAAGFIRRFVWKPHKVQLPPSVVEELNRFAREFQKAADSMSNLAKKLDQGGRRTWKKRSDMILKNLQRMNRLLSQLNRFFDERAEKIDEAMKSQMKPAPKGDFSSKEEEERFKKLGSISPNEIKGTDWEEIIRRLTQE